MPQFNEVQGNKVKADFGLNQLTHYYERNAQEKERAAKYAEQLRAVLAAKGLLGKVTMNVGATGKAEISEWKDQAVDVTNGVWGNVGGGDARTRKVAEMEADFYNAQQNQNLTHIGKGVKSTQRVMSNAQNPAAVYAAESRRLLHERTAEEMQDARDMRDIGKEFANKLNGSNIDNDSTPGGGQGAGQGTGSLDVNGVGVPQGVGWGVKTDSQNKFNGVSLGSQNPADNTVDKMTSKGLVKDIIQGTFFTPKAQQGTTAGTVAANATVAGTNAQPTRTTAEGTQKLPSGAKRTSQSESHFGSVTSTAGTYTSSVKTKPLIETTTENDASSVDTVGRSIEDLSFLSSWQDAMNNTFGGSANSFKEALTAKREHIKDYYAKQDARGTTKTYAGGEVDEQTTVTPGSNTITKSDRNSSGITLNTGDRNSNHLENVQGVGNDGNSANLVLDKRNNMILKGSAGAISTKSHKDLHEIFSNKDYWKNGMLDPLIIPQLKKTISMRNALNILGGKDLSVDSAGGLYIDGVKYITYSNKSDGQVGFTMHQDMSPALIEALTGMVVTGGVINKDKEVKPE